MLDLDDRQEKKQILIDQSSIETDFIDDPAHGLSITFPSVNSLVGKLNIQPKYLRKSSLPQLGKENSIEELKKLLRLKDRFKDSTVFKTRLSELASFCGDLELASKLASEAVQLQPDDLDIRYRLGEKLLENDQNKDSYKIFKHLDNKNYISATLRLAEYEVSRNRLDKAIGYAQKVVTQNSRDWRANLLIGTIHLAKGEYGKSIHFLREASLERPNLSTIYLNKSLAYYLLGNSKRAIEEAKKALSLNPGNKSALTLLTDISFRQDTDLESSKYYLDKYHRFTGPTKELVDGLSNYYYKKGQRNEGIKLLEDAKGTYNTPDIFNNLGVFWIDRNLDKAAKYFYQAIESAGGIDHVHESYAAEYAMVNLARILLEHRKIDECLSLINNYLKKVGFSKSSDEMISKIYTVAVWCYFRKSDDDDALEMLHQLETLPDITLNLQLDVLGVLTTYNVLIGGDLDASLHYAQKAYEISLARSDLEISKKSMILNNLIFVYLESNQLIKAKELIGNLRLDVIKAEYSYATLGLLNIRTGNIQAGKHYYEIAIGKSVNQPQKLLFKQKLFYELGKYYISKGLPDKAKNNLKKVVKIGVIRSNWDMDTYVNEAIVLLKTI
jgi:tetratricopeptide (TPR) repeat protein